MVGGVAIGRGAPVTVQSMTNTRTSDVTATVEQIIRLQGAGCEIVRVAVPDMESASALRKIKKAINIPLIADIHFDWRLALEAIEQGVDALRLNPGNIGPIDRVREVVRAASVRPVPIRIGVNSGSLEKAVLEKHGGPSAEGLVESALRHVAVLEDMDFREIKISVKASDIPMTVEAYRLLSEKVDYPLHIGITEAGTIFTGAVKSAVGLGILLAEGIGDTLRVSLCGDPVEEVRAGWEILKALGLRKRGVTVVSCPTCGRIRIDCPTIAERVEKELADVEEPVRVAVMGCVVNGPGEAAESDVAIAGGDGVAMLYVSGKAVRKLPEDEIVSALTAEVRRIAASGKPLVNGGKPSGAGDKEAV